VPEKGAASFFGTRCGKHRKCWGFIFLLPMIKFGNFEFIFGIRDA